MNTNVPDSGGGGSEDGGEWRTFFVGDAHIYDPTCGLPDFQYCTEPYACDVDGADIAQKLQSINWNGTLSNNELHEYSMWKDPASPPNDGIDYLFADKYSVAWYLGHGNVGYITFSAPHGGDPWGSPCVLGGVQIGLGKETVQGGVVTGGAASVFVNISSCGGFYGPDYDTQCMDKNWDDGARQVLAFAGSPIVAKLQVTDFIGDLEKGKDNLSAWLDVMHINHDEPFKENNPVVYTYAAASDNTDLGTIADNANILTGDWIKPPLPAAMPNIAISAHSGSTNQGNVASCLPNAAPVACQ